jgi:hypothetical protein
LNQLLKGLPLVGPHDEFGGPDLEIPDSLVFHFPGDLQRMAGVAATAGGAEAIL